MNQRLVGRPRLQWSLPTIAVVGLVGSLFAPAYALEDASAGPHLEADPVAMETALDCPDGLSLHPERPVILLVTGTGSSGVEAWGFGTRYVLHEAGFDWCMVAGSGDR